MSPSYQPALSLLTSHSPLIWSPDLHLHTPAFPFLSLPTNRIIYSSWVQRETHTLNTPQDNRGSIGSWWTQEEKIRHNETGDAKLNTTHETRTIKIRQEKAQTQLDTKMGQTNMEVTGWGNGDETQREEHGNRWRTQNTKTWLRPTVGEQECIARERERDTHRETQTGETQTTQQTLTGDPQRDKRT